MYRVVKKEQTSSQDLGPVKREEKKRKVAQICNREKEKKRKKGEI